MAVVYNVTVRSARLQVVANAIDAGAGNGVLRIGTANMGLVLSSIVLAKPCATISSGVLTISHVPLTDVSAAMTGVAASGRIDTSAGTVVVSCLTVGLSTAFDIIISKTGISAGDIVTMTSGTIVGN